MKESLNGLINYIYNQGFDSIFVEYVETNNCSKRLFEKLGFIDYKMDEEFSTSFCRVKIHVKIML